MHDLDFGVMSAIRDFDDLTAARAAAERDLPMGVPVGHSEGGFVVGHDGVAPPPGALVPAFVLWPDGAERRVDTHEELADALLERLDWLVERASALGLPDVDAGRAEAVRAIDALAAGGELTRAACGPVFHAGCVATVEPVARLLWNGFRHGWERSEGPPAEERRHPVHYQFDGAFTDVWRDGFRAGAAAARLHLTAAERAALAPEPTERDLHDRRIEDPAVRARSHEVHADVRKRVGEVKRLHEEGRDAAAREALAALQRNLLAAIREAEADERPDAAKLARSIRRIAAGAARLAEELAGAP